MGIIRILFLADTHLGFDLPFRPRIQRRRRGPEFFANFKRALLPALQGRVDCVVHGGDLLFRSKIPPRLVAMAFKPLKQVADQGTPLYLVPGNHERSAIPHSHLAEHPGIELLDVGGGHGQLAVPLARAGYEVTEPMFDPKEAVCGRP